jgi:hypothetical protein
MKSIDKDPAAPSVSPSGKTSLEFSAIKATPLDAFLVLLSEKTTRWNQQGKNGGTLVLCMDPKGSRRGESLTPNISEWPNAAAVCSLSQVLEKDSIPQRYSLSPKACAGILRRAEKRGKRLPDMLEAALTARVAQDTGGTE